MRNYRHLAATFALSLTLLTLPATLPAQDKKPLNSAGKHMDPWTPGSADENELMSKVRHSLLMLPYYGVFDDLGFRVNGSTVTLQGEVTRPTLKDDAANAVKKVAGVTNVVNNIEVLPLSPIDDNLRRAIYRAIYGDPGLSTQYAYNSVASIHIIVKNGNVRLEGVVATQGDKDLANIRANGVNGVFSVVNDLQVQGKTK